MYTWASVKSGTIYFKYLTLHVGTFTKLQHLKISEANVGLPVLINPVMIFLRLLSLKYIHPRWLHSTLETLHLLLLLLIYLCRHYAHSPG